MDRRSLLLRVLTAVVGIPALLGAAWAGGWWWAATVLLLLAVATTEFTSLYRQPHGTVLPLLFAGQVGLFAYLGRPDPGPVAFWIVAVGTIILFVFAVAPPIVSHDPSRSGMMRVPVGMMVACWAYLGISAGVLAHWGFAAGLAALLWLFLVIWANDIAAYFAGHAVGRHKLAPALSPGKSWEGALAGLVGGTAASWALATVLHVTAGHAVILGLVVVVAAQVGDLFESALKRRAGVKDSGVIFPGHGGVLDRFDGVFAAAPVAYLVLELWAR